MSDYKSQTLAALKTECTSRGLAVSGTKAVVIARLEADDEANGTSAAPAPVAKATGKKAGAKAATAKKAAANPKKRKAADMIEDDEEEDEPAVEAPKETKPPPAKKGKGTAAKLDQYYRGTGTVYEDGDNIWDVMLMQVSIERNNNKYYVLQLIDKGGAKYDVFTRWGRVNEPGQNKIIAAGAGLAAAKSAFEQKFKQKTKNVWGPGIRDTFVARGSGEEKYTLMDMADAEESAEPMPEVTTKREGATPAKRVAAATPKYKPCTLEPEIQELLKLVFNEDTITEQLVKFEIDTNKMPVGRIAKAQLEKGRAILEQIAKILNGETKGNINELTSQFYTFVPQDFGRKRPPPLNTLELVQGKFDMINTLTDMAVVQDLLAKEKKETAEAGETEVEHPMMRQYRDMDCDISVVKPGTDEYDYVKKYFDATKRDGIKLRDVFAIDRKSEEARYAQHDSLGNRRLLWHGTNVAVVVAILKTGLRIMPHSGGRVGRGIYHASENSKSAAYVGTAKKTGIMFINEVVMGKPKEIITDDSSLKAAPSGYDSVLAQGWTDPNPANDIMVKLGGRDVRVPQSKPEKRAEYNGSSRFSQCEWLVYKESQVRMRYMLRIDWPY